jgi:hypothetical protein
VGDFTGRASTVNLSLGVTRPTNVAERLLGQGLTDAGRMRSAWFTALVRKLFGDAPPSAPGVDIEDRATWPPVRMGARHHASIEEAARAVIDGFLGLHLQRAANHLNDEVWMLWGDGTLRCHPWMKLIQALDARKGTSVFGVPREIRTYAWAELRAHVPRPAAVMLDMCIGLPGTMVCTMNLETVRDPIPRVMIALAPAQDGWRALNFPLPSIDTAVSLSKVSLDEEEWLRFADKIARQYLLHNGNQLRSLRNHMKDRVFIGDAAMVTEQWFEQLDQKDPPADRLETVFLGPKEEPFDAIDQLTGRALERDLERKAKDLWHGTFEELRPKLVCSEIGVLDPKTQSVQAASSRVVTMMVRCVERDPRGVEVETWRVAGVWTPIAS